MKKASLTFKEQLIHIYRQKGTSKKVQSNVIKDLDNYDKLLEESKSYHYPGPTYSCILDVEQQTFQVLAVQGTYFTDDVPSGPVEYLIDLVNEFILDDDRQMYLYTIDKLFSYHLYLYSTRGNKPYKSSFTFRGISEAGKKEVLMQQNIPIRIKNGEVTMYFISVTNISHITTDQNYTINFYNSEEKESVNLNVEAYCAPEKPSHLIELSDREKDILILSSDGMSAKEISGKLEIAVETVNRHKKNMIKKNKMKNIIHLASEAIKKGVL
ncbi:LuxR C-terminal-related transcriptional regulator [Flammeovirga agarivorans]|uniref:HTH luxR-type domain-containing protein n=1 Tax=Flammeovirga agarivorans TaxID=2726742 RepID=A0A7X8SIT3_9BACT|nr:LuxR C-terminal-related transcriptional regulator [Flammeovirga agarivorans]NLR91000.1 hypothetical protein [Flammeovirga agarivorans]